MKSKTQKQKEAKERQEAYNQLSKEEKIALLPKEGAKKQRKKFGL